MLALAALAVLAATPVSLDFKVTRTHGKEVVVDGHSQVELGRSVAFERQLAAESVSFDVTVRAGDDANQVVVEVTLKEKGPEGKAIAWRSAIAMPRQGTVQNAIHWDDGGREVTLTLK
ncbi:MAG: hypothetical protein K1X89_15795 [Myxococcaceae bacterium]|nr:hypothetical protein [Myxococcaceae bacterium]